MKFKGELFQRHWHISRHRIHCLQVFKLNFTFGARPLNVMSCRCGIMRIVFVAVLDFVSCRNNLLLIVVDDLRTEISAYPEGAHVHTPNMQRIADQSVVFERAYAPVANCMPSRTAALVGRRPDTTKCWALHAD